MTLNALQLWRKAIPFVISVVCVVPLIGIRAQDARECALILTLTVGTAFLYVILGISEPRWEREMENHVKAQIRENLITLIPGDLNVTAAEREQLANSEILKELTGIFWETVDQNDTLRSQKQYFYSNGLAYSTAVDGFLLCTVFGFCYAMAGLILTDMKLLPWAVGLIGLGLVCRWLAIPRIRQRHLALSREQLDLLKREEGDIVADRFRKIVLDWRAKGRPGISAPPDPRRSAVSRKEGLAGVLVVIAFSALAMMSRGWFGPGPWVKLAPEVKSAYVSEGPHNKFAAVVFVHGIFGTKEDSWLIPGHTVTFPGLLSNDPDLRDKVDVFAFEYYTPKFGAAPSIVDLDDQLRGALDDHQIFENHTKIIFLAHSMGGIVVRHFLLSHQDRIEKVPMVFFYATPTNGSEMAAVGQLVSINPQLRGMLPLEGNDLLQSIQSGWLNSEKAKSIASHCAVEELPTFGVMIVTRSSATSLCNRALDPFSANHIDIVKPTDREDPRHTRFVSAIQESVPEAVKGTGELSDSSPAQFDFLRGEWESQDHDDHFRIHITWDPDHKWFVGKMTKLGKKTAAAGFQVGEIVWTGEPKGDHILSEKSKAREDPKSEPFWISREIDINLASHNSFVGESEFTRVPESRPTPFK